MRPSNCLVTLKPRNDLSPLQRIHSLRSAVGQRDTASDLSIIGFLLAVSFTYLQVHPINALLIAITVVSQAALGTVVLIRITLGTNPSATLLLGPGVIFGGAISFAIFQIAGRGWLGILLVTVSGLAAVIKLTVISGRRSSESHRAWWFIQMVGLAALALTWEFGELLPVALGCFVIGLVSAEAQRFPRLLRWITGLAATGLICVPLVLRQDYWWLVTDDYMFFEVLSRHINDTGPFADWGASNWSQYHWLSYGWSGLLNTLGGSPATLVTLTRVMPLLYSLSLAASLIHIAKQLNSSGSKLLVVLPAWTIVSLNRLDWSGTSTSGVYAVLAALVASLLSTSTTIPAVRSRVLVYLVALPVVVLTKLPSIFAAMILLIHLEAWSSTQFIPRRKRVYILASATVASIAAIFLGIWAGSIFLGGWSLGKVNPALGELAERGVILALLGLILIKIWIWTPVILGVFSNLQRSHLETNSATQVLMYCALPLLLSALMADVLIAGRANSTEYFSGPLYFLGLFALLSVSPRLGVNQVSPRMLSLSLLGSLVLTATAVAWNSFGLAEQVWKSLDFSLLQRTSLQVSPPLYLISDGRFVIAVMAGISGCLLLRRTMSLKLTVVAMMFALTCFTFYHDSPRSTREFRRERHSSELATNLGSLEEREVGLWLQKNSEPTDIIATNSLGPSDLPGANFALAMWSQREFLVIGPRFVGESQKKARAIDLSLAFANTSSVQSCHDLRKNGVSWFIVDLRLTGRDSWAPCAARRYGHGELVVLQLAS